MAEEKIEVVAAAQLMMEWQIDGDEIIQIVSVDVLGGKTHKISFHLGAEFEESSFGTHKLKVHKIKEYAT